MPLTTDGTSHTLPEALISPSSTCVTKALTIWPMRDVFVEAGCGFPSARSRNSSRHLLRLGLRYCEPAHDPGSTMRLQGGASQRYNGPSARRNGDRKAGARPGDSQSRPEAV